MFGLKIDPNKLDALALNFDPNPVLRELSGFKLKAPGMGAALGTGTPYANMIMPGEHDWMKSLPQMAPLDPRSMAALGSMLQSGKPQSSIPQFVGGATPRGGQQVNIPAPAMAAGSAASGAVQPIMPIPSLAMLMSGRMP